VWPGSLIARIVAILVVAVVASGAAWKLYHDIEKHGYDRRILEENAQSIRDLRQNEIKERNLQAKIDTIQQEHKNEIQAITDRYVRQLGELRKRADRPIPNVPAPPRHCEGATGAELSGPDAGFLAGEAARGNRLRDALATCYGALDAARAAQPQPGATVAPAQQ
jgi:hypothetical protein